MALYRNQFEKLYSPENRATLNLLEQLITPDCRDIVNLFYSTMLTHEQARIYLNSAEVENRLKDTMTSWIENLLTEKTQDQIDSFVETQLKVGHAHSRINIPMTFVDYGSRLIKQEISQRLLASSLSKDDMGHALILVNALLDLALALINETYVSDLIEHERSAQSLRVHSSNAYLAYECEQLRSSLFDWFRKLITALSQNKSTKQQILDITQTDFGLWVTHKARLIFTSHSEIDKIEHLMQKAQYKVGQVVKFHNEKDWDQYAENIDDLSEIVSESAWLIASLA